MNDWNRGDPATCWALQARYVFPVDGPPLHDAAVTISGPNIRAVGPPVSGVPVHDLGHAAIIPGLVNAHTHLEFSGLAQPLDAGSGTFADWIRRVIDWRRQRPADVLKGVARPPIEHGLRENLHAGTTLVGEIATEAWRDVPLPVDGVVFRELIGLRAAACRLQLELARGHLSQAGRLQQGWQVGISPHAPYTVHPDLLCEIARWSAQAGFPVAVHLAESREELQLLQRQEGPLVELLRELDAWDPAAIRAGTRPRDYLSVLARARRVLVVHGNYLDAEEIAYLGRQSARMSVVYCPRTHARFGHRPYPLAQMLAAGVNVALGTDSRASNPDLSLLAELRYLAARHPDLPPERALALATRNGAVALGRGQDCGTIRAGKRALLTIIPLGDGAARDPHELLLDSARPAQAVVYYGQWIELGGAAADPPAGAR